MVNFKWVPKEEINKIDEEKIQDFCLNYNGCKKDSVNELLKKYPGYSRSQIIKCLKDIRKFNKKSFTVEDILKYEKLGYTRVEMSKIFECHPSTIYRKLRTYKHDISSKKMNERSYINE